MSQGTPGGEGLGYPFNVPQLGQDDPLADIVEGPEDEAPAPEAPEPEPEPQVELEPVAEVEGEAEEAPEGEPLYAGRYRSVEDLEKGYKEFQAQYTRQQQELLSQRQEMEKLKEQSTETQQLFSQMAPLMQEVLAGDDPEMLERLQAQQLIAQQVEEKVAPMREQMESARQQQEMVAHIAAFRARHPDVAPNTQADFEVAQVVRDLDLRVADPDALEIAYEAHRWPGLRTVLVASPHLVDSDEGMNYARVQAQQLFGPQNGAPGQQPQQPQQPQAVPQQAGTATRPPVAAPRGTAFVETGGAGAPVQAAPGERPQGDEFDSALQAWASEKNSPLFSSYLFGGKK